MSKEPKKYDEFPTHVEETTSKGKEISNFEEPKTSKTSEFFVPKEITPKSTGQEFAAPPSSPKPVKKGPTSTALLTSLITATVVTGGSIVTTAVALNGFSIDVKLFSSSAYSLVFEVEARNVGEEDFLFMKLTNEEQEYFVDYEIREERFYAFEDLSPSMSYTLTVYHNEKVEYTGMFVTPEEYVHTPFIEVMNYEYNNLEFFVFNENIEAYPILTVQAKQNGSKKILNQDTREMESVFRVDFFKPTEPIFITVYYLGKGLTFYELEPLGEEPIEPSEESSSSENPSEPDYSESSESSESYDSEESSESEYSEDSSEEVPPINVEVTDTYIGFDSAMFVFVFDTYEGWASARVVIDDREVYFDESDEEALSHTILMTGLQVYSWHYYQILNGVGDIVHSDEFYTASLGELTAKTDGTYSWLSFVISEQAVAEFSTLDNEDKPKYGYRVQDGYSNVIYDDVFTSSGADAGQQELEIWPKEAIFTEQYSFSILLNVEEDPTGASEPEVLYTQYYSIEGEERLSMDVSTNGSKVTLSNPQGFFKTDFSYTFHISSEDTGYDQEIYGYLGEQQTVIDLTSGGFNGQPGSFSVEVESGLYTLAILVDEELVFTSLFEVSI